MEVRVSVCGTNEVLAIVRDVTERKRLEEEVLEIAARVKPQFISLLRAVIPRISEAIA